MMYLNLRGYLNERQKRIKDFIVKEQPIKLNDLVKAFQDISIHTLKKIYNT